MADDKPVVANKDAMSRALGAAFLSHQVEQLEKTVMTTPNRTDRLPISGADGGGRGRGGGRARGNGGRGRNSRARGRNDDHRDENTADASEKNPDQDDKDPSAKDAELVVIDASVLVNAIGQVQKWCRNKREEVLVVPLEALNTLDRLKKGTTPLAQRARAASRFLEQVVGTNPRIKVQRDDAYVLWEEIQFENTTADDEQPAETSFTPSTTPEWLRRTICCAKWEGDHFVLPGGKEATTPTVVIAVSHPPTETHSGPEDAPPVSSPVPLPAPPAPKNEQRSSGTLVAQWAKKAGITVLELKPTPHSFPKAPNTNTGPIGTGRPRSTARHGRGSSDEEWRTGPNAHTKPASIGRKNGNFNKPNGGYHVSGDKAGIVPPGRGRGEKLVERPAATMAMNASIMQPNKVVRVLARGEKLDP
ncbi:hypothetical protein BD410DRAFT_787181 [Rickenella mellea]|uniref:PIN domain-containing protein n=1 Tax=Rickenella mellea TaxID=50990 RepID=A0A4Y7Q7V3_9AGAM|nr:hypothetical protein BD410DRAFT_787181 [Rickenella mellea]